MKRIFIAMSVPMLAAKYVSDVFIRENSTLGLEKR
jgi:hypothetical protein